MKNISSLLLLLIFGACTKTFEFEPKNTLEELYYLQCAIEVDQAPFITIGKAISFSDLQEYDYICDATVELKEDNDNMLLNETVVNQDICQFTNTTLEIAEEKTYEVKVNIGDGINLSSELTVPVFPDFSATGDDGIYVGSAYGNSVYNQEFVRDTFFMYDIRINYEQLTLKSDKHNIGFGVSSLDTNQDSYFPFPELVCDESLHSSFESISGICILNETTENFDVGLRLHLPEQLDSITIVTRLYILDDILMQYNESINTQNSYLNDPFVVPIKPYTNIEGGAGVFGSYTVIRDTMNIALIN